MADIGPGKKSDAYFWKRVIAVLPLAAIESIHELCRARDRSDWHATTDDLSISGDISSHIKERLRAARMAAKTGDNFIHHQSSSSLLGDASRFLHEVARLQVGMAPLNWLY